MKLQNGKRISNLLGGAAILALATGCAHVDTVSEEVEAAVPPVAEPLMTEVDVTVTLEDWPALQTPALDPEIEAKVESLLSKMTLEQKVGQVIQADNEWVTPEEVKTYRLGSVLSGGNSAPGDEPYATMEEWLAAADAYWAASIDPEGVEVAIPVIWGIDAVHGHANLAGATVFPHNIGLGAANNPDLIEEIARITARELVVSGHDWTFAPTIATPQDDRWGRTYEGYSERPEIVAAYAERIVYGLQGHPGDEDFLADGRVISSAKHYLADGGTVNGNDQGDARISEAELRDIHAQGYFTALEAGVQTVMSSFSSWNGVKMHGSHAMLTDLLKGRLGFNGFVVGDWNGHGQVPGCTPTDCPQSLNAGLDMYMAPDSWKGLYESTLQHAKSGEIPMERLDDAVRRILRVKLAYGIMDKAAPSERPGANDLSLLGTPEARAVARQAVRESLVLLKNNDSVLPLAADTTVVVVGDGADNISKAAGGWTLSWQGGGYANEDFPNGQSILDGIRGVVEPAGGEVVFDPDGTSAVAADVVIAVYGEDPYAEGIGDVNNLDFRPNGFDTERLEAYKAAGIPVVSVFLSGRPLWVNPELNDSDAFVAAWLPGSEGAGVADVLFQTEPEYDFTGRLSFSWPRTASGAPLNPGSEDYDPLFAYGFGLSYASAAENLGELSEDPEIVLTEAEVAEMLTLFSGGAPGSYWSAVLVEGGQFAPLQSGETRLGGLTITRTDYSIQEDGLVLTWADTGTRFAIGTGGAPVDVALATEEPVDLVFMAMVPDGGSHEITLSGGCSLDGSCAGAESLSIEGGDWSEYRVPVACLGHSDLTAIRSAVAISSSSAGSIALADMVLQPTAGEVVCSD